MDAVFGFNSDKLMMKNGVLRFLAFLFFLSSCNFAHAMEFESPKHEIMSNFLWVNENGGTQRIYATGKIEPDSGRMLSRFVEKKGITDAIVFFNSGGGSLFGAIELGKTIRNFGFDTGIASFKNSTTIHEGVCASACTYAFAGGINRYFKAGATQLGLHQFYTNDSSIRNQVTQEVSGVLVSYLQSMGLDALAFSASTMAAPNEMIWLEIEDSIRLGLANNGEQPTTVELKLNGKITYLKIEQKRANATARFLLYCENNQITLAGGFVSSEENARSKYDWATRSYLTFDGDTIQLEMKEKLPRRVLVSESVIWVNRALSKRDVEKLLVADTIGVWVASDGALAYGALAKIAHVKSNIQNILNSCSN